MGFVLVHLYDDIVKYFNKPTSNRQKKKYSITELKERLSIGTEVNLTRVPIDGVEPYLPNPTEWIGVTPYKVLSYFRVVGWHDDIMFVRQIEGNFKSVVDSSKSPLKIFIPNHPTLSNTDINEVLGVTEVLLTDHSLLKLVGSNAEIDVIIRNVTRTATTSRPAPTRKKVSPHMYSFRVTGELLESLSNFGEITHSMEKEYHSKKIDIIKERMANMETEYMNSISAIIDDDIDRMRDKI
jgi:hypothetical protein